MSKAIPPHLVGLTVKQRKAYYNKQDQERRVVSQLSLAHSNQIKELAERSGETVGAIGAMIITQYLDSL